MRVRQDSGYSLDEALVGVVNGLELLRRGQSHKLADLDEWEEDARSENEDERATDTDTEGSRETLLVLG